MKVYGSPRFWFAYPGKHICVFYIMPLLWWYSWLPVLKIDGSGKINYYTYVLYVTPNQEDYSTYRIERRYSALKQLYDKLKPFIDTAFPNGMHCAFPNSNKSVFELICPCFTNIDDKLNFRLQKLNDWIREICLEPSIMKNELSLSIILSFIKRD